MHPNPRRIIPILLLVTAAIAAGWYFSQARSAASNGKITASGTVEANSISVASEMVGKVAEVLVVEGEAVKAGQILVRFSNSLLEAQLNQALATQAQAQANYDLVAAGAPAEQRQASIASAQLELTSARQALRTLQDTAGLARAQAEQRVAVADKALDQAHDRQDSLLGAADPEDIERASAQVVIAADALKKAKKDYDRMMRFQDKNVSQAMLQIKVANAQTAYDAAVTRLNNLRGHANRYEEALAEANVQLAEATLADAQHDLEQVVDGPDPDALALAQDRLAAAEARLAAAQAGPSAEQLAVATAQLDSARAAVQVIQAQLEKLVLPAPADGILLERLVEPGEIASMGSTLLTLARLDLLTLTIYVPEDRYGAIQLGQEVQVQVDSYPGLTFTARVVNIADQAEFTPRNVQTVEGRRNTVFAIKLAVSNPDGKLKPGMPADVEFGD